MILEYLGGIETSIAICSIFAFFKILEYLGGIETDNPIGVDGSGDQDFRIPRRD